MKSLKKHFFKNAPRILFGAFFLCTSCKDEPKPVSSPEEPKTPETAAPAPKDTPKPPEEEPKAAHSNSIRFMAYNIENYLTMTRYKKGGVKELTSKDPREIKALVEIIVDEKPDILGICEIGTPEDLKDLQTRLKDAGLDLPHTVHAGGSDTTRRLAILSALPITANNSQDNLPFQIEGRERLMGRGILDVTIALPNGPTHFVGLHLKSKREVEDLDQAEIRLNEARLARSHCDAILAKDPNARIVVYGDMNDTRKTPPLSALMGQYRSKDYIGDVFAKDSRGDLWTHFWSYQQQYSRFDWVLVSPSVYPEVSKEHSYIADPENWNDASDHRAVVVTFGK